MAGHNCRVRQMSARYDVDKQQGRHIVFVSVLEAMRCSPNNGRITNVSDLPPPAPFFSSHPLLACILLSLHQNNLYANRSL
jgi:hypothetical protein